MKAKLSEIRHHVREAVVSAQIGVPRNHRSIVEALVRADESNLRRDGSVSIRLDWERAPGIEASLHVEAYRDGRSLKYEVAVNWGATTRTAVRARAAATLYGEVADLACELEAYLSAINGLLPEDDK